ncbi:protein kinase [bacterium]|nr:protein kinase [bacterium]
MPDSDTERDPIEALASEFIERQRRGESPSVDEYAEQHPELADEIRDLFPTIAATERLKAHKVDSNSGGPSLRGVALERLGDFRIVREIGRGGMGIVYEAEQESLGRRVAIKVLPRQALLDAKHLKRFRREARIAAGLHHTNIVEVFGVGEQDGFHYYVMQYIEGAGLDDVIERLRGADGPRDWRNVAEIGLQVVSALDYAHSQGTLHRDIKPANLLVDGHGVAWVTDFGLAKAVHSENVTQTGDVAGTLRYMAPEQLRGESDARSDLYSLGLTLYELATLSPAHNSSDRNGLIRDIAQDAPTPPRKVAPRIPRDLETVILKAIARAPGHRYASAAALAADLQRFLDDRPIHARRASSIERVWRWCRRNRATAALTATTLLSLVLVAVAATAGYLRTKSALEGEARERLKAEASARLAADALDRIFSRFSPRPTTSAPELSLDDGEGATLQTTSTPTLSREAATMLEDMLPFYDRLAGQSADGDALRRRAAEANRRVGDIRHRLGQYEEAVAAYRRAVGMYEALAEQAPHDLAIMIETAAIHNELGRAYHSSRLSDEAKTSHGAALAILRPLAATSAPDAGVRCELARTLYLLGVRERPPPTAGLRGPERRGPPPHEKPRRPRDGKLRRRPAGPPGSRKAGAAPKVDAASEGVKGHLDEAIALLRELVAEKPTDPRYPHLLALCHLERGSHSTAGEDSVARGTEILERLVDEHPGVADYRYDLSEAYVGVRWRRPSASPDEQSRVEVRLRKALVISVALVAEHPHLPHYRASQAVIQHELGAVLHHGKRNREAEHCFRKAVSLQAEVTQQLGATPSARLWQAAFQNSLADLLGRQRNHEEARELLESSVRMLNALLREDAPLTVSHALLAHSHRALAASLRQAGEHALAAEADQQAYTHDRQFRAAFPRGAPRP